MAQKQHRMSLKCLQKFFYLPARPTKPDQWWKFSTTAFFIQFGQNLVWGLIMNQKQHRISLKCLQQFSDLPAWPIQIDHRLQPLFSPLANSPHIPSRTIILFRFLLLFWLSIHEFAAKIIDNVTSSSPLWPLPSLLLFLLLLWLLLFLLLFYICWKRPDHPRCRTKPATIATTGL